MKIYVLLIWTRNDHGSNRPSITLAARNQKHLSEKFYQYAMNQPEIDEEPDFFVQLAEDIATGKFDNFPEAYIAYHIELVETELDDE